MKEREDKWRIIKKQKIKNLDTKPCMSLITRNTNGLNTPVN